VNRILVAALSALLLLSCGESADPPPSMPVESSRDAAIAWMKQTAVPLSTVEAGHGFADLAPLTPVLAGVRVVGLGEATHGTREFFQLKHRMFEYLVSELGFTVFTLEANFTEAFAVDHYVLTGEGDPARALAGLYFWTWNTEEVLELIRWMRAYNADPNHPRKLRFYGMDSQLSPGPAQALLDYLAQVDPAYRAEVEPWLTRLLDLGELNGGMPDEATVRAASYITPVRELRARLEAQREPYVQALGEEAYVMISRHARTLEHSVVQSSLTGTLRAERRDEFAMENLRWILDREGPGAKMAIWAHNAHLMRNNGKYTPTGALLKAELGDAFYMFRLAFNQGEFRAVLVATDGTSQGLQTHRIDAAPKESFEAALAATKLPQLALDLRAAPTDGAVARYLDQRLPMREIGAAYTPGYPYLTELKPRTTFDGVLFVNTTTATRPNPPLD
jgi:erythromycin esterase